MVCSNFCFVPLFLWEEGIIGFFHNILEVSRGVKFGCNVLISFHVGILIIFDSAPESIKKSISRSGG